MRKSGIISFVTFTAFMITSCEKEVITEQLNTEKKINRTSLPFTTFGGNGTVCGSVNSVILYAGQNINVGDVKVWNDANNLYVKYETDDPWKIYEIHLYVGDCDEIPQNNGNPTPGHFPIHASYPNGVTCATFCIPLSSLCECFCIAAHAVVINSCTYQEETAWGDGCDFPGRNWATFFNQCKQPYEYD